MTPAILTFLEETLEQLQLPVGAVLEVGSQNVNGTPRSVFEKKATSYTGIDCAEGDGVDICIDAETITARFASEHFDTVICCETLEHLVHPWLVVEHMKSVLKPGGHLWVSTPTFHFPLHCYPLDCYRFGEDAYRLWLFAGMELLRLAHLEENSSILAAVGRKPHVFG